MTEKKIQWKWHDNGDLSIWNILEATRSHPVTGEEIWFNQIHANHCTYYKAHPNVIKSYFLPH